MANNVEIKYTKLFIDNEWVDSQSGKTFPTLNPATEEKIVDVSEADSADIDLAVAAAKRAFHLGAEWRRISASQRGRFLYLLADAFERDIEYLARLESLDNGKTVGNAKGDVGFCVLVMRYFAGWADKIHGKTIPVDGNDFSFTLHQPVGVVGAIIPWNYPLLMFTWKVAAALACGCTIVIKPAEQTPLSALYAAQLCKEVGIPKGVVNVVPGYGPTAGAAITNHHDINKVAFTGSTDVGRIIMTGAAQSNLKRITLELGGKSPCVIMEDADLDVAAEQANQAAMTNHGQCCCAGSRTFVHESIYEEFIKRTKVAAEKRIVGDPFVEGTIQGPQIDEEQFTKILSLIESGKEQGARVITGGDRAKDKGYFVQPTVFADVTDNMRIAKEEIFGPVQSIFKFKTMDELIERCNDSQYGLAAGIFTNDINKALVFAKSVQAGTVWINCYEHVFPQTPFGGFKQSGIGRELGEYALHNFIEVKTVTIALPEHKD